MARANPTPPLGSSGPAYAYPTPAMVQGYTDGINGMPGSATPLVAYQTSNLGAPAIGGPMTVPGNGSAGRLSLRQRLAILILGADAGTIFMPPQQPLQPIAQPVQYGTLGRQWDYPVGYNTRVPPRSGAGVSFAELGRLAEYDVLRIMIERVKDKILAQKWTVGPKDDKATRDARSDEIEAFLEYPDKLNCWDDWCRMLMDQVIVYDAPAVWLRPTRGGDLYGLEILDGTLISPKIMADGRLPPPEFGPAYQQVIKGLPAVDYIQPVPKGQPVPKDPTGQDFPELYYRPRYKRVQSVYGYSAVEQIVRTIEVGVAQEEWLRDYFKNGSTPDLLLGTPDTWNSGQIEQMQNFWDSVLPGNLPNRRGARFIPGGIKPIDTKEKALMDAAVQEWLVRVMCFSLGLNPMPFVKMMNKGQEETHHAEAAEEGLKPWLEWIANFVNTLIAIKWGYRDVQFRWVEENPSDPKTQAEIDEMLIDAKVYHPDEVRAQRGEEAMPDDLRNQMDMATFAKTPNATVLPDDQQAAADERTAKAAEVEAKRLAAAPKPKLGAEKGDVFVDISIDGKTLEKTT